MLISMCLLQWKRFIFIVFSCICISPTFYYGILQTFGKCERLIQWTRIRSFNNCQLSHVCPKYIYLYVSVCHSWQTKVRANSGSLPVFVQRFFTFLSSNILTSYTVASKTSLILSFDLQSLKLLLSGPLQKSFASLGSTDTCIHTHTYTQAEFCWIIWKASCRHYNVSPSVNFNASHKNKTLLT